MGILDDAASIISARSSHSKHSKHSKSGRSSRHHHSHSHSHSRKDRSKSRSRSRSRHRSSRSAVGVGGGISGIAASIFGGGDDDDHGLDYGRSDSHHHRRRSKDDDGTRSFFSLPNPSRSSFFSGFGGKPSSGPSYYRRSPRPGFVSRMLKKLKRLLRDLIYYAKRHPMKVFMLVLMPLLTGGALTALLARFGLRLPPFLERMLGLAARAGAGDSLGVVGEAVRMVSSGGGSGSRVTRTSVVQRGREGGMAWEARRSVSESDYGLGGGGGWGDGLKKGFSKMFS
ncbi:hypothetical protein C8A03DRAFT_31094 [Achaetomium macrosporum]|uniref:Uncharacterized protein n=1 Tax=Achaetomium macrosporum TaxID=79813 RepID=A0AAN7CEY6_9PEZI|nr:hypothetical protein C8A03DRAFT_31094 [Achaetomium macrosporum]